VKATGSLTINANILLVVWDSQLNVSMNPNEKEKFLEALDKE